MKVDKKELENSELELIFELEDQEWNKFLDQAAQEISKEVKVDGFRPGFAPRNLIEQKVGPGKVLERAGDIAVRKTYFDYIKKENIEVVGMPEINILKLAPDNPFQFKAKVAVLPQVQLGDYLKIAKSEKQKKPADLKIEKSELDEALKWLQRSRTQYVTVSRPAQKNDRVEVDFVAKEKGRVIEGGESKNHPLVLGEGKFIPGFEENLEGLKENEEKKFDLTFPADYYVKDLAGKNMDFEVKMNLVQEPKAPQINDEFAKNLGNFESLQALENNIKEGLLMEKEQKEKEAWRAKVLEKIVKDSKMELPEVLVSAEQDRMVQEFKASIAEMGLDFKTYLEKLKKTEEELKKEWRQKSEERVRSALALRAIAQKENIGASAEEVQEEINKTMSHYPDIEAVKSQIDMERLMEYTKERLRNEKVFQMLEKQSV